MLSYCGSFCPCVGKKWLFWFFERWLVCRQKPNVPFVRWVFSMCPNECIYAKIRCVNMKTIFYYNSFSKTYLKSASFFKISTCVKPTCVYQYIFSHLPPFYLIFPVLILWQLHFFLYFFECLYYKKTQRLHKRIASDEVCTEIILKQVQHRIQCELAGDDQ